MYAYILVTNINYFFSRGSMYRRIFLIFFSVVLNIHDKFCADEMHPPTKNSQPVADELKCCFDIVVGINQFSIQPKKTSIATFGLGGCIAGYISTTVENIFFHFLPVSIELINSCVFKHCVNETVTLHFCVPGEFEKGVDEKWRLKPRKHYMDVLQPALIWAKEHNCQVSFHGYNESRNDSQRYQETAWIDVRGSLFLSGYPVFTAEKSF